MEQVSVGARGSALSRRQTEWVIGKLQRAHPTLSFGLVPITTGGDRSQSSNATDPAWGTGVFVTEIEAALLNHAIQLAVHSLKDLPPQIPDGLALAAIPEREDPGDALITADGRGLDELPAGSRVGTASARRSSFLRHSRPDLRIVPIRGNVDSRCQKVLSGEYDAVILAQAGLHRLGLNVRSCVIDPFILPSAPGQGALAVEVRTSDEVSRVMAAAVNHEASAAAVAAERSLMQALQGGCRLPLAALGTCSGEYGLHLSAAVASQDGATVIRHEADGDARSPLTLAHAVAEALRAKGAGRLLTHEQ